MYSRKFRTNSYRKLLLFGFIYIIIIAACLMLFGFSGVAATFTSLIVGTTIYAYIEYGEKKK